MENNIMTRYKLIHIYKNILGETNERVHKYADGNTYYFNNEIYASLIGQLIVRSNNNVVSYIVKEA